MPYAKENCPSGPEFHRRREPSASPFWRIVDAHYAEFERVYPRRYSPKYGFWRPVIALAVGKFLKCGAKYS